MKLRTVTSIAVAVVALLAGCAKEPEATATNPNSSAPFFGDTQTKIVHRNVGPKVNQVPDDRKVYFQSLDEATAAGYQSESEARLGADAE